jgi:hypothetical protein
VYYGVERTDISLAAIASTVRKVAKCLLVGILEWWWHFAYPFFNILKNIKYKLYLFLV